MVYSSKMDPEADASFGFVPAGVKMNRLEGYRIKKGELTMKKYVCGPCGYEYDPEVGDPDNGIAAGTAFEDLPEDWVCPICGVGKDEFAEA